MTRPLRFLLSAPAVVLVGGLVLVPLVFLVRISLCEPAGGRGFYTTGTITLTNFAELSDRDSFSLFAYTAVFGTVIAGASVLLGYPLALFVRSLAPRWQAVALALILVPKTAGVLATLFGLQRMIPRGPIGAAMAEVYLILPYVVLILVVQLQGIDPTLSPAARGLGASRWQTFRRITLPLSMPGVILAAELGLLWGLSAFLGPAFLGGPAETTVSVDIYRQAFEYGRWPRASADAVGLLVLIAAAVAIMSRFGRHWRRASA